MIRAKNHGESEAFYVSIPGSAAVATAAGAGRDSFLVPFSGFLVAYWAKFAVNGVDGTGAPTQNVVVDILQNGTSIFTATNANKINWLHTALARDASSYGVLVNDPVAVTAGDQFEAQILQILNGTTPTQPISLNVGFLFSRRLSPQAATLVGTFNLDLD